MGASHQLLIEEGPGGDAMVAFPQEFLAEQDWREGDEIDCEPLDPADLSRGLRLVNKAALARKAQGASR